MPLNSYNRLLFIEGSSTIYSNSGDKNNLITYLNTNEFNGVVLQDVDYTNAATLHSFVTDLSAENIPIVGIVGSGSSEASSLSTYYSSYNTDIDAYVMYNRYWDSGSEFSSWKTSYDSIYTTLNNKVSSSFYVGYYQTTQSQDINVSGYTEISASLTQIAKTQISSPIGVLFSIFDQGIPTYNNSVNNKKSTNTLKRLDILADAARRLNLSNKLPVHFYIHAGQVDYGDTVDFSGFSISSKGTFENFEKELLKTVVNRMTKFQRDYLDIKGFVYYKYPYAQAALNAPNCVTNISITPSNTTSFINWSIGTGGTPSSYDVYIDTTSNPSGSATPVNVSINSYTATGLTPSTTYYVAIIAKNSVGVASGCVTSNFTTTANVVTPVAGNSRILLIDDYSSYDGDTTQENLRLSYADTIGCNWIQLYGAVGVNSTRLASFIKRARQTYGISKVSAIVFNRYQASQSLAYNLSRVDPLEQFDDFNIENEFWFGDYRLYNKIWITSAVNGATYTARINGIDYTVTSATTNEASLAQTLYNQIVTQNGSATLFNGVQVSYDSGDDFVMLTAPVGTPLKTAPAPITNSRNVFTSGSLVAVSSSYNPGQLYAPFYTEAKYNGTIVSGDRSPYRTTDDVNYDQSKIAIEDRSCTTTLHWLGFAKWLDSIVASLNSSNGTNWTVSAYVQNYSGTGQRWGLTEAKLMVEYIDLYESTNYVPSIDAPRSINSQLNLIADATRITALKPSQSFVPLWSGNSNGPYLSTYRSNFYPDMDGGLDQAEYDWSSSFVANINATSQSYLHYAGTGYFYYTNMQVSYAYP